MWLFIYPAWTSRSLLFLVNFGNFSTIFSSNIVSTLCCLSLLLLELHSSLCLPYRSHSLCSCFQPFVFQSFIPMLSSHLLPTSSVLSSTVSNRLLNPFIELFTFIIISLIPNLFLIIFQLSFSFWASSSLPDFSILSFIFFAQSI